MTSSDEGSQFGAAPSATGYLYQCRYALLHALRRLRKSLDFSVSLETLDDVVFERAGGSLELLQTKHHINRAASLTDASPDLWKTIRVWSDHVTRASTVDPVSRWLVTTATVGEGSAAAFLRADQRDEKRALQKLLETARTSTNATNKRAYASFLGLTDEQRASLLGSMVVLDNTPIITEIETALTEELVLVAERKHLPSFLQRLEGWWFRRAVHHLARGGSDPISAIVGVEIDAQISELREQFKQDNLPIDEDLLEAQIDINAYLNKTFVHQLRLIDIGGKRLMIAIREYFRAFEQRSRWVREDLLLVGELDRYERRLLEEWEIQFARMCDELGSDAAEKAKKDAARLLYKWVEAEADFPIRASCTEPFVTRGSYHILADGRRVGWHPEFLERLKRLLEGIEAA